MNIFKVLAQGDGNINEPNVSAFLGYLLNPAEDHGLNSMFLEDFLRQHYAFCDYITDLKTPGEKNQNKDEICVALNAENNRSLDMSYQYEVKVFFEQAFREENKKEVVDIILVVYEIYEDKKKWEIEKKFENYLIDQRELKQVFLVEVKVKDGSTTETEEDELNQLEKQLIKSISKICTILQKKDNKYADEKEVKKLISAIFVTPGSNCSRSRKAFAKSYNTPETASIPKSHIFWNRPEFRIEDMYVFDGNDLKSKNLDSEANNEEQANDEGESKLSCLAEILDDIIYPEKGTKQRAIPQYTIDTMKSFSDFIDSNFSYKMSKPKKKRFLRLHEALNASELTDKLKEMIKEVYNSINKELNGKIDKVEDFGTNHIISYYIKNTKFASITYNTTSSLKLKFLKRNFTSPNMDENKILLENMTKKFGLPIKGDRPSEEGYFLVVTKEKSSAAILSGILIEYYTLYKSLNQ
jgi:hypothetical protein